jgi:translation initiation factor 4G
MDQYFDEINKIIKRESVTSRIRFMLQDLQDLRKSNWVPRRADNAPKTIQQIHKEAEQEKEEKQAYHALLAQQPRSAQQGTPKGNYLFLMCSN